MYFGNYWHQFGYHGNQSNLDTLFQNKESTIEDFLNEDNIITEIKLSVQKFSDHIIENPDKLEKLIDYVINQPDTNESIDQNRWYKYPFLSSEIFAIQLPKLASFLFEKIDLDLQKPKDDSIDPQSQETQEVQTLQNDQEDNNVEPDVINQEQAENQNSQQIEENQPQIDNNVQNSDDLTSQKMDIESVQQELHQQDQLKKELENEKDEQVESKNNSEQKEIPPKQYQRGNYYLKKLLDFTVNEGKLNPTSAGYFQKTISMLITKYGYFWSFLIENPDYLKYFVLHTYNVSICNLILKLLVVDGIEKNDFEDSDQKKEPEDKFFNQRVSLLECLFQQFKESQNSQQIENLSQIFIEIIQTIKSNENSQQQQSLLQLDSEMYKVEHLQILQAKLSNGEAQDIFNSTQVLNEILIIFITSKPLESHGNDDGEVNYESKDEKFNYPVDFFINNFENLFNILKQNHDQQIETSYGGDQKLFGFGKIKILELIGNLLKTKQQALYDQINNSDFYNFLFEILLQFEWNNILHIQIEKFLNISLDSDNEQLLESIFVKSNYVSQIINAISNSQIIPGSCKKPVQRGYLGFLTNFSKTIKKYEENGQSNISKYLQNNDDWKFFVDNDLKNILDKESQILGGEDPRKKQQEEQEDNMIDLDINKIYDKFRSYFNDNNSKNDDNQQKFESQEQPSNPDLETIDVNSSPTRKTQDYEEGSPEAQVHSPDQQTEEISHKPQQDTAKIQAYQEEYIEEEYLDYGSHAYWKASSPYNLEDILKDIQ